MELQGFQIADNIMITEVRGFSVTFKGAWGNVIGWIIDYTTSKG